eukprot:TRINITY_DN2175_c0_g2_i2.p2 TRINITY_DN2175_c0_g2~~TRINITY_DN2175_c0_g2_i2.p2  ORF type:complete len:144 (-),score=22.58 TRINITY_DN2175_c0_g2_i2:93-524(-)
MDRIRKQFRSLCNEAPPGQDVKLTRRDFTKWMKKEGATQNEINATWNTIVPKESTSCSLEDFDRHMMNLTLDRVREKFRRFDANGDRQIDFSEFKKVFKRESLPDRAVQAVFKQIDVNGDGVLSLEEFSAYTSGRIGANRLSA